MKLRAAVAMLCVLGTVAAAPEDVPADAAARRPPAVVEATWRMTDVPGFVVYGNVDERALRAVANGLARLRAVLARAAAGLDTGGERPIPVFAFKTKADFQPYAPVGTKALGGYFATAYGYRAIALDLSSPGAYEAVYHELVHHVVRRNFGDVPLWFNEGIATLYETFQCSSTKATVGLIPHGRLEWLDTHTLMPVQRLAAVTEEDPDYNETERAGTFYLESWLLVHDLLFGHPARGAQLAAYLQKVHEGKPQEEALEEAFTGGAASLDAELDAYRKAGAFPFTDIAFDDLKVPPSSPAKTLDRAGVLGALGLLALVARPKEPDFARIHFEALLAIAPADPRAQAGLGAVALVDKHDEEALARIGAAVTAGIDDPALLVLGARAILDLEHDATGTRVDPDQPPSPAVLKARLWLVRAIRADPFNNEALAVYGLTFVASGGDVAPGIAAFERADAIDPLDDSALYDLLELYVRKRDRTKAESLFAARIESKSRPEVVAHATEALLRLDFDDARDAIEAGDYVKAISLVTRVRDKTANPALRERMNDLAGKLEAAAKAASGTKKPAAAAPKR